MSEKLIWKAVSGDSEFQDDGSEIQIEGAGVVKGKDSIFTIDCGEYHGISNEMAERIALCLNACEGLSNEALNKSGYLSTRFTKDLQQKVIQLEASEARLREAVNILINELQQWNLTEGEPETIAVIKKAAKALSTTPNTAELERFVAKARADERMNCMKIVCKELNVPEEYITAFLSKKG